jgi:hypothetical protein
MSHTFEYIYQSVKEDLLLGSISGKKEAFIKVHSHFFASQEAPTSSPVSSAAAGICPCTVEKSRRPCSVARSSASMKMVSQFVFAANFE